MPEKSSLPSKPEQQQVEVMRPLTSLRQDMDRLFDEVMSWSPFRRQWMEAEPFGRLFGDYRGVPHHADVVERKDAYEIDIDVPGMEEKDLDVSFADGCLTVRGEMREEREEKGEEYWLTERRRGSFSRSFRLPEGVDENKIQAELKKGVLMITVPKSPEAQKRQKKISVKASK